MGLGSLRVNFDLTLARPQMRTLRHNGSELHALMLIRANGKATMNGVLAHHDTH